MTSLKSLLPDSFTFHCTIPIRITDLNYGGHVGNDRILALVQEARVQFLASRGYTEMNVEGCSLILTKATVELRKELHYGETIRVGVAALHLTSKGFDLIYLIETGNGPSRALAALALTTMLCYDYEIKKTVTLPSAAVAQLAL